jgi:hypothetical protein
MLPLSTFAPHFTKRKEESPMQYLAFALIVLVETVAGLIAAELACGKD